MYATNNTSLSSFTICALCKIAFSVAFNYKTAKFNKYLSTIRYIVVIKLMTIYEMKPREAFVTIVENLKAS